MYRSILVPLDGSTFAEHALPIARSIAHRAGATLQLVLAHVPISARYVESRAIFDETLDTQLKEQERIYLDGVIRRLTAGSDIPITSALLDESDSVAKTLNDHAEATGVDLIVMATHGRGTLARLWIGSVADRLVRYASTPILLVRPQEAEPDLTREPIFQHMIIPLDGSGLSERILPHAVAFGELMQADYTLLRVIEPVIPATYPRTEYAVRIEQQLLEQLQTEVQTYLDGIAERLRAQIGARGRTPLQVQTKVVIHRHPAIAILEEADTQIMGLIAMETHGRGGLTRWLIGSVADKVLRRASIPVLLHRSNGESL